ncbi:MAG TPA: thioredoxin family protein [Planctomycetaceae bacterium]|nr:thioredoxin family protein [Planctomycetaceae bacterium]
MPRFLKSTLRTISLTIVALAAITGHRAQSADTDLRPAIEGMRDEVRELRRDVKALRELLERREDPTEDTLPDLPGVHIESYLESNIALRAQSSISKMTGGEIIASIDGRPVFASEIFQRLFTKALTPEGTTLLTATQSLASGQISEQDFRELQVFAIRKFAKDYIRTRVLSQATIASLGKKQKEKTEDTIAKEFDNYVETLKKDFNVTSIFEVNKRLRKQGTSLLSLKDEFRDRLLADQYLREHATRVEEPPSKHPKSQLKKRGEGTGSAITKESPISPEGDDAADQGRVVYFFFAKWCGPCQQMMPIIDRLRDEGYRIVKVDIDAGQELVKRFNIVVVPTLVIHAEDESVILHGVQSEETLREKLKLFKNLAAPPKDILSQTVPRGDASALERRVTINCDNLPLSEVLEKIFGDWSKVEFRYEQPFTDFHYSDKSVSGWNAEKSDFRVTHETANAYATCRQEVTLHVADVPVSVALQRVFDQLHLRYQLENGVLRIDIPADEKLREALQRKVRFDCDKIPFQQFLLRASQDLHLKVAMPSNLTSRPPITLHVSGATIESVLKMGFEQAGVRCKFVEDVLVLSPAEPQLILTYPVADLLTNVEPQSGVVRDAKIDFNSLETLIRTAVEPKSWEQSGGEGHIVHSEKTLSLVIRQTMPVHDQIRNLLQKLRQPQQLKYTLRGTLIDDAGGDLLKAAGIEQPLEPGQTATLTKKQLERLLRLGAGPSLMFPKTSAALGQETSMRSFAGAHAWPEAVQVLSGQIGSRAYVWFELTGTDPETEQPLRAGAMSLAPDFKPLLVRLKTPRSQIEQKEWPWRPSRTVDQLIGKPPERKLLLIRPEVEAIETPEVEAIETLKGQRSK